MNNNNNQPKPLVEELHRLANSIVPMSKTEWDNDYERNAEHLTIAGDMIFPKEVMPQLPVFEAALRQKFMTEQNFPLPQAALHQLVHLSYTLPGMLSKIYDVIFEDGILYSMDVMTTSIAFNPHIDITGVVDIVIKIGLYPMGEDPRKSNRNFNLVVSVRGFYDPAQSRFQFPIYWPDIGFNSSKMSCDINLNVDKPEGLRTKKIIFDALYTKHKRENPKWKLTPHLQAMYKAKTTHALQAKMSAAAKTKIWQYFLIGSRETVFQRPPLLEKFCTQFAAELLTLGEQKADSTAHFSTLVNTEHKNELLYIDNDNYQSNSPIHFYKIAKKIYYSQDTISLLFYLNAIENFYGHELLIARNDLYSPSIIQIVVQNCSVLMNFALEKYPHTFSEQSIRTQLKKRHFFKPDELKIISALEYMLENTLKDNQSETALSKIKSLRLNKNRAEWHQHCSTLQPVNASTQQKNQRANATLASYENELLSSSTSNKNEVHPRWVDAQNQMKRPNNRVCEPSYRGI
jgi:hypothetical protein